MLKNAIRNLIPVQTLLFIVLLGHWEMIMGLDLSNVHVMDNNWVLFGIWRVQLPFLWLSSHSYFHAYQTTPVTVLLNVRARGLHCVYVSLVINTTSYIIIRGEGSHNIVDYNRAGKKV